MAQETNQSQVPMLCTLGCGFYGSPRTNGMCSVCYKEHVQRQQAGGHSSPPGDRGAAVLAEASEEPGETVQTLAAQNVDGSSQAEDVKASSPSPVTQKMTAMSISQDSGALDSDQEDYEDEEEDDEGEEGTSKLTVDADGAAQVLPGGEQTPDKNKKNRCFTCRKKVGLTGFDCRCGRLFCAAHRYSDKHECPFDYRGAAAARLRKENPMVVAEKIQKL